MCLRVIFDENFQKIISSENGGILQREKNEEFGGGRERGAKLEMRDERP